MPADWWNLGAVLLELYRAVRKFDGRVPLDGHYEWTRHLAEITPLFGPISKEFLARRNQDLVQSIFDDKGKPKEFRPIDRPESEAFMTGLDEDDRHYFGPFLRIMMRINP